MSQNMHSTDVTSLIAHTFGISERIIGLTNSQGSFVKLDDFVQNILAFKKDILYVITAQDLNSDHNQDQNNMSFASDRAAQGGEKNIPINSASHPKQSRHQHISAPLAVSNLSPIPHLNPNSNLNPVPNPIPFSSSPMPQKTQGFYMGVIGDLQLFEQFFLNEQQATVVFCFVKQKPKNIVYPYYLYHTDKNAAMVYVGRSRVCQFYIEDMSCMPRQIEAFVRSLVVKSSSQFQSNCHRQQCQEHQQQQPILNIENENIEDDDDQDDNEQDEQDDNDNFEGNKNLEDCCNAFLQDDNEEDHQNNCRNNRQNNRQNQMAAALIPDATDQMQSPDQDQLFNNNPNSNGFDIDNENDNDQQAESEEIRERKIKASLLENLLKLKDDDQVTELQFYRMKSELLESMEDFMRKYQMGSRKGFRKDRGIGRQGYGHIRGYGQGHEQCQGIHIRGHSQGQPQNKISHLNQNQKQQREKERGQRFNSSNMVNRMEFRERPRERERNEHQNKQRETKQNRGNKMNQVPQSKNKMRHNSRQQRRATKYQIPIIVRKYNNVIEKISTSYPLSQEQEHSINLILELELKGLISEKESGVYKSSILQEDPDVFPLFMEYFNGKIDQIQLVSRLKKKKKINSERKQRSEHNMRLLMKYSKQCNYEMLRTLLLQKNSHLMACLDRYRDDKNPEMLNQRLSKIAEFYRKKQALEGMLS